MSTQQLIIIFSGVGAIIVFALSHTKIAKGWKILFSILFLACIVSSSILNWSYTEKKENKEVVFEKKFDQLDTHLKASMTFEDYIQAARLNRKEGRTVEAIYDIERALEKKPNSPIALNLLGVLCNTKGDYDRALEAYQKIRKGLADSILVVSPELNKYVYHRNFAKAYMSKNMWKEAKEELLHSLSLNESDLTCYVDLAKTLNMLNEWEELYEVCKKGILLFPNSAQLHNFLGIACVTISRFDEAEAALLRAVQVDSTFAQPYLLLAVVYFFRQQPEKSSKFVERSLRLDPSLAKDVEILRAKKYLR